MHLAELEQVAQFERQVVQVPEEKKYPFEQALHVAFPVESTEHLMQPGKRVAHLTHDFKSAAGTVLKSAEQFVQVVA